MPETDMTSDVVSEGTEPDPQDYEWFGEETATFGDRLAGARDAANLTQRGLAERLGVKTSTLRKWEEDLAEPRANRLQMLAGMLGVTLSWLMTGRGDGPEAPVDEPMMTADVRVLMDELRVLRIQMDQTATKMATLEKRLRKALNA